MNQCMTSQNTSDLNNSLSEFMGDAKWQSLAERKDLEFLHSDWPPHVLYEKPQSRQGSVSGLVIDMPVIHKFVTESQN